MAKKQVVPIGPYHPLQEEPEFFLLHVDGERVLDIEVHIGYNHRAIEKICESKTYEQVPFVVERICGICSTSHPFAYVNAVENLMGLEIPPRAKYIRAIIAELERIHSHLLWLGLAGHFIGYNTVFMWAWKAREPVLDVAEKISGNRQNYAMMRVGGVRRDIPKSLIPWIAEQFDGVVKQLDTLKGAVLDDPVIHARLKGVGILTKEDAQAYGAVGPVARASGLDIDVRRDDPYSGYSDVPWDVVVLEEGDVFAKTIVRVLECYESVRIIKGCLEKLDELPEGELFVNVEKIPEGEGLGRHEAPRGECLHYVRSDGTNRPVRHKVRAPSYVNIPTCKVTVPGYEIADATLILASVDPCYCCTERIAVVNEKAGKFIKNAGADLIKLCQRKTEEVRKRLGREQT